MAKKNKPIVSDERLVFIIKQIDDNGIEEASKMFGLKVNTLERYEREYRERVNNGDIVIDLDAQSKRFLKVKELTKGLSDKELNALAKSIQGTNEDYHTLGAKKIDFGGKVVKYGYLGDTHIGSKYTPIDRIYAAFDEFKKEKVDFVLHGGDVVEGMSNRPGHIYELSELGYTAQKKKAVEVFSQWNDTKIYTIDGNHDRWFIKSNGAYIVPDICEAVPCMEFLGHDEGDLILDNGAKIKLWHGEDGSSYALSYRMQKVIESLMGGEKPNIMHLAHVHKFSHIFERNIHAVSGGCIQNQTKWMRGKRLSAHTCFQIMEVTFSPKGEVKKFNLTNYPFYE